MNASSLIPAPVAPVAALSPEQLARRKAVSLAVANRTLLTKIDSTRAPLQKGITDIKNYLDQNPSGLTREEILATLTEDQREAFAAVSTKALDLLAAFTPVSE